MWQSLFKVYNQTLRKIGNNDFSVEHTEVSKRQREGTLERVVKYDKEAFDKAWAWMASSQSDDEEEKRFLPRKCLGFSVVPSSVLDLVCDP